MNRETIIALLGSDWTAYERLVSDALHTDIALMNTINRQLLENRGKQMRPMISLLLAGSCGQRCQDSLKYAAALEILHNATLLHDDVADNSHIRRNKPTLAALMGPNIAVLIGDYWLSKSISLILDSRHHNAAISLFSAVLKNLAEGEVLQLEKARCADTCEEDYLRIIHCKTASLFEVGCRSAALSVDAPAEIIDAAGRYGTAVGMAFQIRDDIFDYGIEPGVGKPVGADLKEGKITLPLIGALQGHPEEAALREKVRQIDTCPAYCDELYHFARTNGGLDYAARRLDSYIETALDALDAFPASAERDALAQLALYNAIRNR